MFRTCLCVAACFALGAIGYLAAPGQVPASPAAAPVPAQAQRLVPKWEYKAVRDRDIANYEAANGKTVEVQRSEAWNKLGDDGWELASVVATGQSGTQRTYFFKRPK